MAHTGSSAHLGLGLEDQEQQPCHKPCAGGGGAERCPRRRELLFLAYRTLIVYYNETCVLGQSPQKPREDQLWWVTHEIAITLITAGRMRTDDWGIFQRTERETGTEKR